MRLTFEVSVPYTGAMSKASYRTLQPGEAVPPHEPSRRKKDNGYVALRWRVGPGEYVEAYEHRVFDGRVTTAPEVHHINGDPSDNRPENLRPSTVADHKRAHRRLDHEEVVRLYQSGLSTTEVGSRLGCASRTVSAVLAEEGIPARGKRESQRTLLPLDENEIARRFLVGEGPTAIARAMGCTKWPIRQRLTRMGLLPSPEAKACG